MSKTIVIGSGLTGLAVASSLASRGVQVTLVDRSRLIPERGTSASWVLIDPTSAPTPHVARLIAASHDYLKAPPRYFGPVLRPGGVVHIAAAPIEFRRLGDLAFEAERHDIEHQLLGKADLLDEYPELAAETAVGGLALSATAAPELVTNVLYDGLMKRLIHRGGRVLRETEVRSADYAGGAWQIETSQEPLTADIVVNAAGAEAETVAARCGVSSMALITHRRTLVVGRLDESRGQPAPRSRSPLMSWIDGDDGLVCRAEPYGEIWTSPAGDLLSASSDPAAEAEDIARAIERLEARTHFRLGPRVRAWAGATVSRPSSPSLGKTASNPLICWDGRARSFFWAAGFGRFGVQCAVAAGDLAADLITGQHREWRLYEDFGIAPSAFEAARP